MIGGLLSSPVWTPLGSLLLWIALGCIVGGLVGRGIERWRR